jgi:hypothetical protein
MVASAQTRRDTQPEIPLYLLVNGVRLSPEAAEDSEYVFRLNMPVSEVRLLSGHAIPGDLVKAEDRRRVGVGLRSLRWQQGDKVHQPDIGSASFIDGFHPIEDDAAGVPFRWTNGDAGLPPASFPPWHGETVLRLSLRLWGGNLSHALPGPEAAVLSAFENLGANCEFALAQRYYGVEPPLTLLRWSGTTHARLCHGLEHRFNGLGDAETTTVEWSGDDYRLTTPWLRFHTSVNQPADQAGLDDILRTGCLTLRLLRRKLLDDIATTSRIFVFSTGDPEFGVAEMFRLHKALRSLGPASLLCVTVAKPGDITAVPQRLAARLYSGRLEPFMIVDDRFAKAWLALCEATLALHRA